MIYFFQRNVCYKLQYPAVLRNYFAFHTNIDAQVFQQLLGNI